MKASEPRGSADAPQPCAVRCRRRRTCSDRLDEEIPSVKDSSRFLVQTDEDFSRGPDSENDNLQPLKCQFPREIGRSQAPRGQQGTKSKHPMDVYLLLLLCIDRSRYKILKSSAVPRERDPDPPLRQQMCGQCGCK
ncbi:hypothetical protein F511_16725 [Dorcoceras hygrometricum]|uniref:Uncharacterized protein n=1 Tax=Dorcoceras hygrometricum TaxID=472368 RepID=A0A2Z7B8Z2_9LAMI|nr:hypothetical protein F511_16725 [Dorcoceras hygrometricum]